MVLLNDLLVCAVCHNELSWISVETEGRIACSRCDISYPFSAGVYNMTPLPLPDENLRSKWDTWEKLQANGLRSYTAAPEFNLSIGNREDAQAFKEFAQASGLVLDIGCGPQTRPSYLPESGQCVGMDPLLGQQPRGFSFVQGIGEYLPFRDGTFDHILYASSLDHIMNPRNSLAEASRCLKPAGQISLWIDGLASDDPQGNSSRWERYSMLARKGIKSLSRHNWLSQIGLRRTFSYLGSVARMEVPEGASDYFHFVHLNLEVVSAWLNELNLITVRQQEFPEADSLFIQVKHGAPATRFGDQKVEN